MNTCIFCDEIIPADRLETPCSFHPGRNSFLFTTGADAGRYDVDMAYRDIYTWSCCGKQTISRLGQSSNVIMNEPPPRSPGCITKPAHKLSAKISMVAADEHGPLIAAAQRALVEIGITVVSRNIRGFVPASITDEEAIILFLPSDSEGHGVELTTAVQQACPSLPLILFSDPDRIDGLQLQAQSASDVTPANVVEAAKHAIRRRWTDPARPTYKVFLSYTRRNSALAKEYIFHLSNMITCWVDINVLSPGVRWADEIVSGIQSSNFFLLLVTPETPEPTYCWLELEAAIAAKKKIFCVCHGATRSRLFKKVGIPWIKWERDEIDLSYRSPVPIRFARKDGVTFFCFDSIPRKPRQEELLIWIGSLADVLTKDNAFFEELVQRRFYPRLTFLSNVVAGLCEAIIALFALKSVLSPHPADQDNLPSLMCLGLGIGLSVICAQILFSPEEKLVKVLTKIGCKTTFQARFAGAFGVMLGLGAIGVAITMMLG